MLMYQFAFIKEIVSKYHAHQIIYILNITEVCTALKYFVFLNFREIYCFILKVFFGLNTKFAQFFSEN